MLHNGQAAVFLCQSCFVVSFAVLMVVQVPARITSNSAFLEVSASRFRSANRMHSCAFLARKTRTLAQSAKVSKFQRSCRKSTIPLFTFSGSNKAMDSIHKNDTQTFSWTEKWYPICPIKDLNREIPNPVKLLGIDLVIWFHEPSRSWLAFRDACPHRLAPLSEGRISESGNLQCAYHGWEFGKGGECHKIPQTKNPGERSLKRACVTSFPTQERQDLLWIFFSCAEDADRLADSVPLATIPAFEDPNCLDATDFFMRDLPYSWEMLVENLVDPAHVPFAHHGTMGNMRRESAKPIHLTVLSHSASQGFRAERKDLAGGRWIITFFPPCMLRYEMETSISSKNGSPSFGLGMYCIPTGPGSSRLITRFPLKLPSPLLRSLFQFVPRWMNHFAQNDVMDSDVVFLTALDRTLSASNTAISGKFEFKDPAQKGLASSNRVGDISDSMPVGAAYQDSRSSPSGAWREHYYMPAMADACVIAFRRWLDDYAGGGPSWRPPSALPASASKKNKLMMQMRNGDMQQHIHPTVLSQLLISDGSNHHSGRRMLLDRMRQHTEVCSDCRRAYGTFKAAVPAFRASAFVFLTAAAAARGPMELFKPALAGTAVVLMAAGEAAESIATRFEYQPWPRDVWIRLNRKDPATGPAGGGPPGGHNNQTKRGI